jgi:hypothetical protein
MNDVRYFHTYKSESVWKCSIIVPALAKVCMSLHVYVDGILALLSGLGDIQTMSTDRIASSHGSSDAF